MMKANGNVQAVFIDRDGTIGGTGHFIHPRDFRLYPNAQEAIMYTIKMNSSALLTLLQWLDLSSMISYMLLAPRRMISTPKPYLLCSNC